MTESRNGTGDDGTGLAAFMSMRPRLFGIAYRMLGSVAEAEDVVQEVWLRWQTADRRVVRDAAAFLATTARRLAINIIQSARVRRETSFGACPLEPVDPDGDAGAAAERAQALASGVQVLLEKLTPTEQAAYVLREAFDYGYCDIADALRLAEANARQVVTRARQHMASDRATLTTTAQHQRLLDAIVTAARGEVAGLEALVCHGRRRDRERPRTSRFPTATSPVDQAAVASA